MSQWNIPIEIDFPELYSFTDRFGFPVLPDWEEGIRIVADELNYEDNFFSCHLLMSFAFKRKFASSFQDIDQAINIIIENADTGQCHHMNLVDPHKKFKSLQGDNFKPEKSIEGDGILTQFCEIPFNLELNSPGWGPHLFIRSTLQKFTSNILAIDISEEVKLTSYLDDAEYTIGFLEDDDE